MMNESSKKEGKKFPESNQSDNTICKNLWATRKAVLRGLITARVPTLRSQRELEAAPQ